MTGGETKT